MCNEINFEKGLLNGKRQPPIRVEHSQALKEAASKHIKHVIIIFQENWSFDSLFGRFNKAEGLAMADAESTTQIDLLGEPYLFLPACINTKTELPYTQIPAKLPNSSFDRPPLI